MTWAAKSRAASTVPSSLPRGVKLKQLVEHVAVDDRHGEQVGGVGERVDAQPQAPHADLAAVKRFGHPPGERPGRVVEGGRSPRSGPRSSSAYSRIMLRHSEKSAALAGGPLARQAGTRRPGSPGTGRPRGRPWPDPASAAGTTPGPVARSSRSVRVAMARFAGRLRRSHGSPMLQRAARPGGRRAAWPRSRARPLRRCRCRRSNGPA